MKILTIYLSDPKAPWTGESTGVERIQSEDVSPEEFYKSLEYVKSRGPVTEGGGVIAAKSEGLDGGFILIFVP